jgi:hypothetical protein
MRLNIAAGFAVWLVASTLSAPAHTQNVVCREYDSGECSSHTRDGKSVCFCDYRAKDCFYFVVHNPL